MKLILGDQLSPETRADVLNRYGYRWTVENMERARVWHGRFPNHPTIEPVTDREWLRDHAFWVRDDGKLAENRRFAEPACLVNA